MKRYIVLTIFVLSLFLTANGAGAGETLTRNPGLPYAGINKATYLKKKAEQIMLLRGWHPGKPFNPNLRLKALKRMERQIRLKGQLRERILSYAKPGSASALSVQRLSAVGLSVESFNNWSSLGPTPIPNGQCDDGNGGILPSPVSGRVTAIAIHPTNPDIIYIGTAQGGVWRTLDGGATWTPIFDAADSLAIGAVTIDPLNPSIVFVGTGEGNPAGDNFFGVGLYRIENADTTPVLYGPFDTRVDGTGTTGNGHAFLGTSINKIAVDPNNDNRIFVGNTAGQSGNTMATDVAVPGNSNTPIQGVKSAFIGLYFCPNALSGSPTFSMVQLPNFNGFQGITDIIFEPGSSDQLLVGVMDFETYFGVRKARLSGIYRTIDASVASQYPSTAPKFKKVLSLYDIKDAFDKNDGRTVNSKLAINNVDGTVTVLAATGKSVTINKKVSYGQLWKSTNGGATFKRVPAANGFCGVRQIYDMAVAIDPYNANNIYLGGCDEGGAVFMCSSDGGATFNISSVGLHSDTHAIAIAPSDTSTILTGNDGGIFGSMDYGKTWTSLNTAGLCLTQFQSLALHPTDPYFTIGGTQGNGTNWYKPDQSWWQIDWVDGGYTAIDQNATDTTNTTMYHTNPNLPLAFEVTDSTADISDGSWGIYGAYIGQGLTFNGINSQDNAMFYPPLVLGPGNPNTVYFGTDTLYRSTNEGAWMDVVSPTPIEYAEVAPKKYVGVPISAIGISPQDDNVRIIGLKNGSIYYTIYGSQFLMKLANENEYVTRTVIDPADKYTAYITLAGYFGDNSAAHSHIYKVTDLNSATPSLTPINGAGGSYALPDVPIDAIAVDIHDSTHPGISVLYVGTDIGVYQSVDGGQDWYPFGGGLPRVAVFDMGIQQNARILRIATHGRGMWQIPLTAGTPLAAAVSITPSISSGTVGDQVTFTAQASGGSGNYEYEFFLYGPGTNNQWVQENSYSSTNTWPWTLGSGDVGQNTVKVYARNVGSLAQYEASYSMSYTVSTQATGVTITPSTSPGTVGSPVTFTAQASGGSGTYEYAFFLSPGSGNAWQQETQYSTTNTWQWTPASGYVGQDSIEVYARNVGSYVSVGAINSISFNVNPAPASSVTITPLPSYVTEGNQATFTAQASGGSGSYQYEFFLQGPGTNGQWVQETSYSTTSKWQWTPGVADEGQNAIEVYARNVGSSAQYEAIGQISYVVYAPIPIAPASYFNVTPSNSGAYSIYDAGTDSAAGYWIGLWQSDPSHSYSSVSVAGPGIPGYGSSSLTYNSITKYWTGIVYFGQNPPALPLTYTFTTDSGQQTYTVNSYMTASATSLYELADTSDYHSDDYYWTNPPSGAASYDALVTDGGNSGNLYTNVTSPVVETPGYIEGNVYYFYILSFDGNGNWSQSVRQSFVYQ